MSLLDPARFPTQKFGVGQSVMRTEDPRLLTGNGRYADDDIPDGRVYGFVLRSGYAHGIIRDLDCTAARDMPGVLAIYTGKDLLAAGYAPIPCGPALKSRDGSPIIVPERYALATDRVRHVGEGVAFVVAETLDIAKDAADQIAVEIDPLPAVTEVDKATAPDAPQLFAEMPGNVSLDWHFGDTAAVERAFATAAHVTNLHLINNRVVVAALEPRAAVASYDPSAEKFTVRAGCQGAFGLHNSIAGLMRLEPEQVRVIADDVGGSFGMKAPAYPEYVPLLHAARELGRPAKWTAERTESFVSDYQGRDGSVQAELALDKDGNFLAIRVQGFANLGAYPSGFGPAIQTLNIVKNMPSLYRTPLIEVAVKCVVTNTIPIHAYRGAGRPEGNYYMERLVDTAAREHGFDVIELRRRNFIPGSALPFRAASGLIYDSGDFDTLLDKAVAIADRDGFADRRAASEARGKLRGFGLASYLEVTAAQGREMGGLQFGDDGSVTIITGTLDYGQGHAATFAQILADKLGVAFNKIGLIQGDSDRLLFGGGTGGSRSVMATGTALVGAADEVIARGRAIASHVLEAAVEDIVFEAGTFCITGTDRRMTLNDVRVWLSRQSALPEGLPDSLDVADIYETPPSSFPNGCHVAEVEVDPDTGTVAVVRYAVVDDFGVLINPALVEGQVHGGVVQGLGQALTERTVYDSDGQLVSGSLMDYALPRADHLGTFQFDSSPTPAQSNPLGVKGCGEAGVTGALPAIMNAVVDALVPRGVTHLNMPATPQRVWHALQSAAGSMRRAQ